MRPSGENDAPTAGKSRLGGSARPKYLPVSGSTKPNPWPFTYSIMIRPFRPGNVAEADPGSATRPTSAATAQAIIRSVRTPVLAENANLPPGDPRGTLERLHSDIADVPPRLPACIAEDIRILGVAMEDMEHRIWIGR